MKVHHAGKMGDLIYALPVIRALARKHGKITLVTSALCYQLVPLLWEQPYLADVEIDYQRAYKIDDGGCMDPWAVLDGDGINLSPQPAMYRPASPVPWTMAYADIAGISELTASDKIALPTLWNHRQWFWEHNVKVNGQESRTHPRTVILAPESETLKTIPLILWAKIAHALAERFTVIVIGRNPKNEFFSGDRRIFDLRGQTTIPSAARMLAEAHAAVCANSLPWHLARHAGTPTWCFQDQYIDRCTPVDTPALYCTAEHWEKMVEQILELAPGKSPKTTLWPRERIAELMRSDAAKVAMSI